MNSDMELRTMVLADSLEIENNLSELLASLFKFKKDVSSTLGNKSSALSFKTKADLLRDLGRLQDSEYADLIMFMEIRNQLIHNKNIDSMLKAATEIKKLKKLLDPFPEFAGAYDNANDEDKERIVIAGYDGLKTRLETLCLRVNISILEDANKLLKQQNEAQSARISEKLYNYLNKAIVKFSEEHDKNQLIRTGFKNYVQHSIVHYWIQEMENNEPDFYIEFTEAVKKYMKNNPGLLGAEFIVE